MTTTTEAMGISTSMAIRSISMVKTFLMLNRGGLKN